MGPYSHDEQLAELNHHWGGQGGAYTILHNRDGWQAKRRDGRPWQAKRAAGVRDGHGGWVICDTADDLFRAITDDYLSRPVPRDAS